MSRPSMTYNARAISDVAAAKLADCEWWTLNTRRLLDLTCPCRKLARRAEGTGCRPILELEFSRLTWAARATVLPSVPFVTDAVC